LRRKSPHLAEAPLNAGPVVLDPGSCTVTLDGRQLDMGNAEYRLLKFLMAHRERVFSRSQLLDKVWGDASAVEERTVDVHVLRLRKALKEAEKLIKTVRSVGYMLTEKEL
jgi:two-component system phosphate regulon response regulator PhoB